MSSIFNSEGWKKAVGTYKNNQAAPKTVMPTGAISALTGAPKPTPPAILPSAAIKAANGFRSGKLAEPTVSEAAKLASQRMLAATSKQPRTEQALTAQADLVNTPFTFNPESDPSYQAALRAAQQNLQVNQKNTNAQLRATGQGKSSYSETVANQLANQSTENIANNILPVYAQQAYREYQDRIGNQRDLYNDYDKQDFQNPITEAATTGTYQNTATKNALNMVLMYKAAAEVPGVTAAQRAQYSKLADEQRAIIDANGGDSSKVGANVNSRDVNSAGVGVRTLSGRTTDAAVQSQDIANQMSQIDLKNYPETSQLKIKQLQQQVESGKLTNEQAQYQLKELTDPNSVPNKLSALDLQMKSIDASMYSDVKKAEYEQLQKTIAQIGAVKPVSEYDKRLQELDLEKAELQVEKLRSGDTASTKQKTYEDYQSNINKIVVRDKKTNAIKNADEVEEFILTSDLSDYEQYRAIKASGLTWPAGVPVPTKGE